MTRPVVRGNVMATEEGRNQQRQHTGPGSLRSAARLGSAWLQPSAKAVTSRYSCQSKHHLRVGGQEPRDERGGREEGACPPGQGTGGGRVGDSTGLYAQRGRYGGQQGGADDHYCPIRSPDELNLRNGRAPGSRVIPSPLPRSANYRDATADPLGKPWDTCVDSKCRFIYFSYDRELFSIAFCHWQFTAWSI